MLTLNEINEHMAKLGDWSLEGESISRQIFSNNFKESIEVVNKVAEIAEAQNHHPDIVILGKIVKLTLTTHSEHSLTKKDFEVAEKIDKVVMS
jgi:4a-hydroxytetrahydrobiopterin dehydratase